MEDRFNLIKNYYSILSKIGYINDKVVIDILIYLALYEILESGICTEEQQRFIFETLNKIKNSNCLFKMNSSCVSNKGVLYEKNFNNFSFYDIPQKSYDNDFIKELWQILDKNNLFAVK